LTTFDIPIYHRLKDGDFVDKVKRKSGGKPTPPVKERENDAMFQYWADGPSGRRRTLASVARKFNRARSTMYIVKKRFDWDKRYAAAAAKSRKATDRQVAKKVATTRERMTSAFDKMADAVLDSKFKLKIKNLDGFDKIAGKMAIFGRQLLELEGELPPENRTSIHLYQTIANGIAETTTDREVGEKLTQYAAFHNRGNGGNDRL